MKHIREKTWELYGVNFKHMNKFLIQMAGQMKFTMFYSTIWNSYQVNEMPDKNVKVNSTVSLNAGFLLPEMHFI
jgi:hypothetical protein